MRAVVAALVLALSVLLQSVPAGAASSDAPCMAVFNARTTSLSFTVEGYGSSTWEFKPAEGPLFITINGTPIHVTDTTTIHWSDGGKGLIYWVLYPAEQYDFRVHGYCEAGTWLAVFRQ